ncbi:hypothetical protein P2H44_03355 [Albimonas sp. CAU 1670]|uniref:hypothetical protein n=1 Tax=Albimonas sp. CAU 1670 TaxID=3032599 RepID=UPI0023DADB80|nr:hypothetical protein [Albimonas sp. CAU 1670]MDF2231581.1 hypothetical protein [Albimonas sp. CAU 1670]
MQDKWTHGQATKERRIIDALVEQAEEHERKGSELRRDIEGRAARLEQLKPEGWVR